MFAHIALTLSKFHCLTILTLFQTTMFNDFSTGPDSIYLNLNVTLPAHEGFNMHVPHAGVYPDLPILSSSSIK